MYNPMRDKQHLVFYTNLYIFSSTADDSYTEEGPLVRKAETAIQWIVIFLNKIFHSSLGQLGRNDMSMITLLNKVLQFFVQFYKG